MRARLDHEEDAPVSAPAAKVITVASGKGGVGKTSLVANIGAMLSRSGTRVMLVDGDFGLANLDILFRVQPQATFEDVLMGNASAQDALIGIEPNLWILPASSGFMDARDWSPGARGRLAQMFESCPWDMDLILVDLGSGIQENVVSMHHPGFNSIVVLTPEPTSLTDAYGLMKILRRDRGVNEFDIIVNQVTDGREGFVVYQKLNEVLSRFTDIKATYLGHCARDEKFLQAVLNRKILLDLEEAAPSVPCLELLAKRIQTGILGGDEAKSRPRASFSPVRFREEPMRSTPGITARFWRTLLGEVKA